MIDYKLNLDLKELMDEFTRATREAEKELEIKRGKIF